MKIIVLDVAKADLTGQSDWYKNQGVGAIATKFLSAVEKSFIAISKSPNAGAPRHHKSPRLSGMRTWSIDGFKGLRVYYRMQDDRILVLRVLHDKRNIDALINDDDSDDE